LQTLLSVIDILPVHRANFSCFNRQDNYPGIAFGPRCPLYLFFQKRMPLPSLMRPCLQSVSLLFNKFQAAQQAPARRLAHAPAKSVRTAARYQPILRAHRRAGPCFFSLMSRWFYCPVKQPFQTISVF